MLTWKPQAILVVGVQSLQEDARALVRHNQSWACTIRLYSMLHVLSLVGS